MCKPIQQYVNISLIVALTFFLHQSIATAQISQEFPTINLRIKTHNITAEIAQTPEQHEQGLMFRKNLAPNTGMIFDFGGPAAVCMWMKNTLIPLSVAFADQDGKIINIEDMQAQTLDNHCAKKPIRFALEMNQGWFKKNNIQPGNVIDNLKTLSSKR